MKRIFTFAVNNGGTMTLVQVDDDGPVTLSSSNDPEVRHIPAGDMVIDLNKQTAAVGTTSIMSNYSFSSKFIIPHAGNMTITGTGTVKWRERWI